MMIENLNVLFQERSTLLFLILITALSYLLVKRVVLPLIEKISLLSKNQWDDILVKRKVPERAGYLVPVIIFITGMPFAFPETTTLVEGIRRIANISFMLTGLLLFDALLSSAADIYLSKPSRKNLPIGGFVQFIKLSAFLLCAILVLSQLINRSPLFFFSGLGAMTAVLLIVFKDTLLGLVAGVQITTMDLVREGDWIEMPQHGADGDVIDVSLTTVRVQNWDRTISTIPTYEMVSGSFKNWRGMSDSGGRRIKRSILIDVSSIRFLDMELLQRLESIELLQPYLQAKRKEIDFEGNVAKSTGHSVKLLNGRHLTNIGTFRAYCEAYLHAHPKIHENMTFIVRQLSPTPQGLPLEIYVFVNDIRWVYYESVQSDVFDHLLAVIKEFDLKPYQSPSGHDVLSLSSLKSNNSFC